jgi:cytochrome c
MSTITRALIAAATAAAVTASAQTPAPARLDIGSAVTEADLKRYTSPLPDGRGLPAGSGTVTQGRTIYLQSCAACHGDKLQGGIGDRLIGGRGSLVNSDPTKAPVKTVESYWPYATTLFDYIKRAMPMNAPGSLSDDEVYAVSAYILSQAKIVPEDATLDAKSLAAVRMPNRDGFIPDPRPEKFPPPEKTKHADTASGG